VEGVFVKTIGRHLIAEYYSANVTRLNDVEFVRQSMLAAAERVGATVIGESFHSFVPQGVSGAVVIAESHLSIHTWPEYGYAAVDIFTCGNLNPRVGFRLLEESLEASACRVQEILRGLPEEIEADHTLVPDDIQIISRIAPLQSYRPGAPVSCELSPGREASA
jgi:S-adenosylmethionine decarboxylase